MIERWRCDYNQVRPHSARRRPRVPRRYISGPRDRLRNPQPAPPVARYLAAPQPSWRVVCQPYYAAVMGALSLPKGRYCRMHLVGYFKAIDSERGRGADSLSLRDCAGLGLRDRVFAGAPNNRPCADWWGENASAWTPRP